MSRKIKDSGEVYTPAEYLMMEVIAARVRTGEHLWTFDSKFKKEAESLAERGFVGWKFGIVEKTIMVWFTGKGAKEWLSTGYIIPLLRGRKKF